MLPSARVSSVTRSFKRAEITGAADCRPSFVREARKETRPRLGMGHERREFTFRQRPLQPAELHRHVVQSAWAEPAIEMPEPGYDHPHNRDLDVRPRLIKHDKIMACSSCDFNAGLHLLAHTV